MKTKILFLVLFILLSSSCSENSTNGEVTLFGAADANQQDAFLAYAHVVDIATSREALEKAHASVIEKCKSEESIKCTILFSDISRSAHPSATLRLRVSPTAVDSLTELAAESGTIRRNSTTVEDLAKPIRDTEGNIKKLRSHLADLERLRTQSKDDVRSLIAVTAEIAKVTSRLESSLGEEAHLVERVELQILNINFSVDRKTSFLSPIAWALSDFSNDLSDGIAQAISGFAYLLPWLIILLPLLFLIRFLWRKLR